MLRIATLGGLDSAQSRFIQARNSHLRLLAPAGCGKTSCILWRCRALIEAKEQLSEPLRILVVTLTKGAEVEINNRIATTAKLGMLPTYTTVSTLNAWGLRLLRQLESTLTLVSGQQKKLRCVRNELAGVIRRHPAIDEQVVCDKAYTATTLFDSLDTFKALGFDHMADRAGLDQQMQWLTKHNLVGRVGQLIDDLRSADVLRGSAGVQDYYAFWSEAVLAMLRHGLITFEDQKYWALVHLRRMVDTDHHRLPRYSHIFVDEFQDINPLDLKLLKEIRSRGDARLIIVGDDDQSIYEWRGAVPDFIIQPETYFGQELQTHVLDCNYRSPANIVERSQQLIRHNVNRVDKDVRATRSDEAIVETLLVPSINEGIAHVLGLITAEQESDSKSQVALIGRKRSQIIPYQIAFAKHDVPFTAAEDLKIFLSDAFKTLRRMLQVRARLDTEQAAALVKSDLFELLHRVKRNPLSARDTRAVDEHLEAPATLRGAIDQFAIYRGPLKGPNTGGRMTKDFTDRLQALAISKGVADCLRVIGKSFGGMQRNFSRAVEDIFYTDPPFSFLADFAGSYAEDFDSFDRDLDTAQRTLSPQSMSDRELLQTQTAPVTLMTALRAKGREFDTVVILDANEDIWPSKLAMADGNIEQERRLFYVGMTRAQQRLVFLVNQKPGEVPSRFLAEAGVKVGCS